MTDTVDTWAIEALAEYRGKKFVNALRADADLQETEEAKREAEQAAKDFATLVATAKETLGDKVRDVRVSRRLVDSPSCLVLAPGTMPAHLEGLLRRTGKTTPKGKRDLELNPSHAAVKRLGAMATEDPKSAEVRDLVLLLREQALLAEGSPLDDPAGFARRLTSLMTKALA